MFCICMLYDRYLFFFRLGLAFFGEDRLTTLELLAQSESTVPETACGALTMKNVQQIGFREKQTNAKGDKKVN